MGRAGAAVVPTALCVRARRSPATVHVAWSTGALGRRVAGERTQPPTANPLQLARMLDEVASHAMVYRARASCFSRSCERTYRPPRRTNMDARWPKAVLKEVVRPNTV